MCKRIYFCGASTGCSARAGFGLLNCKFDRGFSFHSCPLPEQDAQAVDERKDGFPLLAGLRLQRRRQQPVQRLHDGREQAQQAARPLLRWQRIHHQRRALYHLLCKHLIVMKVQCGIELLPQGCIESYSSCSSSCATAGSPLAPAEHSC